MCREPICNFDYKTQLHEANSTWAQGGIAAVVTPEDSFSQHIEDTLVAGAGLCQKQIVEHVVSQGPDRIDDLVRMGIQFDEYENGFPSTKKAGIQKDGSYISPIRRVTEFITT